MLQFSVSQPAVTTGRWLRTAKGRIPQVERAGLFSQYALALTVCFASIALQSDVAVELDELASHADVRQAPLDHGSGLEPEPVSQVLRFNQLFNAERE